MREIVFQKQNKAKWQELEGMLQNMKSVNADDLASKYVELTNDLSYAKTHYPKSHSHKYLNQLALQFHQAIYKNKKESGNRFIKFWTEELPLVIRQNHHFLLLSFLILALFTLMGVVSTAYDPNFVRLFLGDGYVDMTLENIKNGRPMDVYGHTREDAMFVMIALNNIMVGVRSYVSGMILYLGGPIIIPIPMLGTIYFAFVNGLMLGTFHTFLAQEGVFGEAVLSVWMHGTIEILTIVVKFAAGLLVGYSILFPKTFSRKESFIRGAKDGLKIIVGCTPLMFFAAIIESFVTRHVPDMPKIVPITFIALSFIFMIWYFVIYPIQVEKKLLNAEH